MGNVAMDLFALNFEKHFFFPLKFLVTELLAERVDTLHICIHLYVFYDINNT